MISSFFNKTQPIHYVILFGFVFLVFWGFNLIWATENLSSSFIVSKLLHVSALIIGLFLADQMAKRGKMTDQSAFLLFFFVVQLILFPKVFLSGNTIFAHLFLIVAVQRLHNVKDLKSIKQKIFDAALLICIASMFTSWILFFFLLVLYTINTYNPKSLKTWLSALAGIMAFVLLAYTAFLFIDDHAYLQERYDFTNAFERVGNLFKRRFSLRALCYALLIIVFALIDFIKYRKKGGGKIVLFRFMLLYFTISVIINILDLSETSFLLFTFFPAAVFLSNYIQTIKNARLKEILLAIMLFVPFVLLLVDFSGLN